MRKTMKSTNKLTLIAGLIASSFALNANAGVVTNDTDLLSGAGHEKLSEWLGQDVNLTRIFAKGVDGNTSYDWHNAVNGQGATFTVMELFDNNTNERRVIGGYNSASWLSNHGYSTSTTAFLFNLSDGLLFDKNGRYSHGNNATYNISNYGATFGAGHDLYVNSNLTTGYTNIGHTYGDMTQIGNPSYREEFAGSYNNWTIGAYETFTLSDSTGNFGSGANAVLTESGLPNDVPVPFALAGLSLLGLGFARRK
jgi:hypothetical protein